MLMKVSFLITVRQADRYRQRNLDMTLAWYRTFSPPGCKIEFVVVEQDSRPRIELTRNNPEVSWSFVYNHGAFNKAWGMNIAAARSDGEVLALLDSDVLVDHTILNASIHSLKGNYDVISPYESLVDLSNQHTEDLRQNMSTASTFFGLPAQDRRHESENLCFCGGLFLIERSFFFSIGGMDEDFRGWGCEDDAMTLKILAFSCRTATGKSRPALHLWHPRARKSMQDNDYTRNRELLTSYYSLSREGWESLVETQKMSMGRPDRYQLTSPTGLGSVAGNR